MMCGCKPCHRITDCKNTYEDGCILAMRLPEELLSSSGKWGGDAGDPKGESDCSIILPQITQRHIHGLAVIIVPSAK
jgi:hypothetical protein